MNQQPRRATPLSAVLGLTALGSVGTGAVTIGVFFLAEAAYGFGAQMNLWLGVAIGGAYIVGAVGVGPGLRTAASRHSWLSTRAVLAGILTIIGLASVLPAAVNLLSPGAGPWSLWVSVLVFSPTAGALWPITESYLSGGRRGSSLIRAIGAFNIVWSLATIGAMWIMVPLIEARPLVVLAIVGAVHVLACGLLFWFAPEPARSSPDDYPHEPHPDSYRDQLDVFRILLPLSYVLLSALAPLMPTLLERLGIGLMWKPAVASLWMAARSAGFFALERWHGWHGRWLLPIAGSALLLVGFAVAILSPRIGGPGLAWLSGGLVAFGLGSAAVYVGALYYVMEVGHSGVDAGGSHEAVIGAGYTLGPVLALAAGAWAGWGNPEARSGALVVILGVVVAVALCGGIPVLRARRKGRGERHPREGVNLSAFSDV